MKKIEINESYEIFQIITDFGDPLEIFREAFQNSFDEDATEIYCRIKNNQRMSGTELIIDIWDNGKGLERNNVKNFFDLANSTKIDENNMQKPGMLGYKGHGSKIFFNSEKVIICSRTKENDDWFVELNEPIKQIENNEKIEYSDFLNHVKGVYLPKMWDSGFFVRIIGHLHFKTEHTKFKINHLNLRDYAKWFTVFGSVLTEFDEYSEKKDTKLYLSGLNIKEFQKNAKKMIMDPKPEFKEMGDDIYEIISLGHHFPEERYTDKSMKEYAKSISSNKNFWEYYSRMAYKEKVSCPKNVNFDLIINIEGYETKRQYDPLLSKRGKPRNELTHSDNERYGIWACKGGIPIEKIDNWIEGGKGTYSFLQAFVNCEGFNLTANRGSIHNSDIEKIDIVKSQLNKIFNSKKIKDYINERTEIEKLEGVLSSIEEDGKQLEIRYKAAKKSNKIIIYKEDQKITLKEPSRLKNGISESETLILLTQLISHFPGLFPFELMDYNTTTGIDLVVEDKGAPKYIELKGSLSKKINHPFRHVSKFICYELSNSLSSGDIIEDIEEFKAKLEENKNDKFQSFAENYKGKEFKSYKLNPDSSAISSMEVIVLKNIISQILDGKIE